MLYHMFIDTTCNNSLIPRPPPFLPSVTIIHKSGIPAENGESLGALITYESMCSWCRRGGTYIQICPSCVHLTSFTWWMLPGLHRFNFLPLSMYYCECKGKIKTGEAWDQSTTQFVVVTMTRIHFSKVINHVSGKQIRLQTPSIF